MREGERVAFEYRIVRPSDGEVRWVRNSDFPLLDAKGRVQRIGGVGRDITEEKAVPDRMRVMVAELQHRTRNLIAVVRSIAQQTMATTGPTEAFQAEFFERLAALSRVQGLLSHADEEPITLEALIRTEIDALGVTASAADRVRLEGPPVRLRNTIVQTLALAIHELATNAMKYGALADGEGRLDVTWSVADSQREDRLLFVEWADETARSLRPAEPARIGYGRQLIERALPYSLGARTSYTLAEHGVRCTIELPLKKNRSRRVG